MSDPGQESANRLEQPFPLKKYFYLGALPGLLLLIATVVYATTQTVRSAATEVMLQLATRKVEGLARGVETLAPAAWQKLLAGETLNRAELDDLAKAFAGEQQEAQISLLKLYGRDRKTIFATEPDEIGRIEDKPALRDAWLLAQPSVLVEQDAQGAAFYELYLPYKSGDQIAVVFELYEPIAAFDALLWRVVRPALIVPLALFCVMLAFLAWLVGRGQTEIGKRTAAIISLRQRIERLVSRHAAAAMRNNIDTDALRPETIDVTLLYTDVRGFTAYSETLPPTEVIGFLNTIIGLQVEIIEKHDGDVDKMIGDAVLTRFHGADRARRAIAAAIAIQRAVGAASLPCGLGIGIFSGAAVAGLIGVGDRYDYTVIGDSVNAASRLCALAHRGEIVADSATVAIAGGDGFGVETTVKVEGRAGELSVRKLTVGLAGKPVD